MATEPMFTPGPWEWSAADNERHAVVSPPVDGERDIGPWFTAIISCGDDAIENANAALIAAAPRMYKALVDVLRSDDEWRVLSSDQRSKIQALLEQARGEHPSDLCVDDGVRE